MKKSIYRRRTRYERRLEFEKINNDSTEITTVDFMVLKILAYLGLTICFAISMMHLVFAPEILMLQMMDGNGIMKEFILGAHEQNLWSWDDEKELLKVNTTFFVH